MYDCRRLLTSELAAGVLAIRPNLPILFMSGYTDDGIVRHGLHDERLNFIQKPIDSASVARKVRELLDSHHSRRGHCGLIVLGTPEVQRLVASRL